MTPTSYRITTLFFILVSFCTYMSGCNPTNETYRYPKTDKVSHTDSLHGVQIKDPFHWLEDDRAPKVEGWVKEQNKVTFAHLEAIPFRDAVKERFMQIYNYPKYSAPFKKGNYTFFYKNNGLQNQSILYIQKEGGSPEVLIDPNAISSEGTSRLTNVSVSKDAKYVAYSISAGGSDWQRIFIKEIDSKKNLSDSIDWVKVSGISWAGQGFFYSRYPEPKESGKQYSAKNENHLVYYHKLNTNQNQDELVFEDREHPLRFHLASVTDDEEYLILSISDRSKGFDGTAFKVKNLKAKDDGFKAIVNQFDYDFNVVDHIEGSLIVQTNKGADNGKLIKIDLNNSEEANWETIVAEKPEPLVFAQSVGGKIILGYMKDVTHRVYVHDLKGNFENEITLPSLGTVGGFGGERSDKKVFYTFTSFTYPPAIYEYDIESKNATLFRKAEIDFNPEDFETKQVFYTSKDGTKVPMFLVYKKGIQLDGNNPTLLYGYGGFNINLNPNFDPLRIGWLEQGGVYAMANLRGGGEYGEKWHQAGMKLNKQNVFDDFIAAAEWLIKEKYTKKEKLGIQGRSNGGLLVGAAMVQRPDLFAVALPGVGVMDMLRYEKFTIGWNWAAEYGSVKDSIHFRNLYKYSPYHNLKKQSYPATLVVTADHDDRVVPAHSFKFMARLQEQQLGKAPTLIRIGVNSGHGASSTEKLIEERADEYSFLMYHTGMTPSYVEIKKRKD
ncbi:MAG: prolyl oligopeptidase family serine peptidase [Chloroherpetonaceae bacterium]|nr:prolyl oligopeptidase family serine peptidase [Chloroherpetonaceae bacterium]